jgi:single-strand DNA-binding protein
VSGETSLTLVGNLTADPELRFTPGGHAVASFTIASTPRQYDRTTNEWKDGEPLFMRCNVWRQLAENIATTLQRGDRVVVTGRLEQRRWETPEGDKRSTFEMVAEDVGPSLRYLTAKLLRVDRSARAEAYDDAHPPAEGPAGDEGLVGASAGSTGKH